MSDTPRITSPVSVVGDSKAARGIFRRGGSQRESDELLVLERFLRMFRVAHHGNSELSFRWVRRGNMEHANRLAVTHGRMDFGLNDSTPAYVESTFGPWDIGRFALECASSHPLMIS